jgi:hypothetical protein
MCLSLRCQIPPVYLRDHEIVTLPSVSTLAVLRSEIAGRKPVPKSVAVLADPVFKRDDARFKALKNSSQQDQIPAQIRAAQLSILKEKDGNLP